MPLCDYTVSVTLDVSVNLSLYFTDEEYYPDYKDEPVRNILLETFKQNVSF